MLARKLGSRLNKGYRLVKRSLPGSLQGFLSKIEPLYRYIAFILTKKAPAPAEITIDPINACNLSCPLCPTGLRKLGFSKCVMDFQTFQSIVDRVIATFPFLYTAYLFCWGEVFLNPDILKMIKYLKEQDFYTLVDTNFSFRKEPDFFTALVDTGLDVLNISLDGASQDTYVKYRHGGDFDLVISNLKCLLDTKRRLKSSTPEVIWKFVVNQFNEAEVPVARRIAHELGVKLEIAPVGLGDVLPDLQFDDSLETRKAAWLPRRPEYINPCYQPGFKGPMFTELVPVCPFLFKSLIITPHGKLVPCPLITSDSNVFGDLMKESPSLGAIWNNEYYTVSRGYFTNHQKHPNTPVTVCADCKNFKV